MTNTSYQMSNFIPTDGKLVRQEGRDVVFSFGSAYATSVHVDLWSDDDNGSSYLQSQDTQTDGLNEPSLSFAELPFAMNLHYQITITGEGTVYVSIDS